jgi:hypothetical protein
MMPGIAAWTPAFECCFARLWLIPLQLNCGVAAPVERPGSKPGDVNMEWVLFVSLQWIVFGSPTQPTTQQIQSFPSEELCNKAADAIRTEINAPIAGQQRVQALGRVVCLLRKEK